LVHCDIKPENVVLENGSLWCIIDIKLEVNFSFENQPTLTESSGDHWNEFSSTVVEKAMILYLLLSPSNGVEKLSNSFFFFFFCFWRWFRTFIM
jgi:serine/threonine protein kinase